jgi:catechol 2,3-dioxygenase-like lactoylglutathione lyase family enzyme
MAELQHPGISVADLDRAVAWYSKHFGFREAKRFEKADMEIKGAAMVLGERALEILQPYRPSAARAAAGTLAEELARIGANHIAIAVGNIGECFEDLKRSGAVFVTGLIDRRVFFCKDPDGTLIEVRQGD